MNLHKKLEDEKVQLQIAPLIDCVFLLLIYFMVTSSLIKKEADISFMLPAIANPEEPISLPIEVAIEIDAEGDVTIEGMVYDRNDRDLDKMIVSLMEFRAAAESSGSELIVTIVPDDAVLQRRIIDVMSACAIAKVKNTSFVL